MLGVGIIIKTIKKMAWNRNHRERKSPRTKGWDYGQTAVYFITICTQHREPYFGTIRNGIMGLSQMGTFAHGLWQNIPDQFSHAKLDEFIVMPNHVHGIIGLNSRHRRDAINRVPAGDETPIKNRVPIDGINKNPGGATGRHNPMLSDGNLGQVIRWYKGRCTFEIHKRNYRDFQWQGRYWDDIIKGEDDLGRIREYIYNNPIRWELDSFYEKGKKD